MTTPVSREAADVALPHDNLSLGARFLGVVRRPGSTFQEVAARPSWLGLLAATTIAMVLVGAAVAATDVGRTALVDQWERTAYAFGHPVTDGEFRQLQDLGRYGSLYAAATAVAVGPVTVFAVAMLGHLFLSRHGSGATVTQSLAVASHAGIILALRQVVAGPISYLRETTANGTALGVWFPVADQSSLAGRFLGVIDVFVLWWVVVLAIGFGVLYHRRARNIALGLIGGYAVVAGALTLAMAAAAPR